MLTCAYLYLLEKEDPIAASAPMISSPLSTRSVEQTSEPRSRLESSYEFWGVIAALTALYVVVVLLANRRFVWFDELFTFDIANAKSIPQMWMLIRRFDFQLPAGFLLSRFSMEVFGQGKIGLRLPSMLEFYVGSMALFFYVRRKVGIAYAAAAVLILWLGITFHYAMEARPYALLLMFFSILLLCWDIATSAEKRNLALWGAAIANLGMLTTHVLAPLSLLPFLAAEAVRFWRTRKPDFALWAALLLPTAAILLYLPLFHGYSTIYFPPLYEASLGRILRFYYHTTATISLALFIAVSAALLVPQAKPQIRSAAHWRPEDLVLFAFLLFNPVLANILLRRTHGAFWDRYAITTEAAIYIGMAILLGLRLGNHRLAGYAAAAILLIFCLQADVWLIVSTPSPQDASVLAPIRPDLPLVAASGVTFFEMNHHEKPDLLSRLYFLKDRPVAMEYTHTNLFEDRGFGYGMRPYFPISAKVESYDDFIRQHRQFLILGEYHLPEEWLLRKLHDDGARLTWLGSYPGPYMDSNLYLVNLTEGESQP
jgi:Dolichyl-phosphate-mannose-protein mannosyltransferase